MAAHPLDDALTEWLPTFDFAVLNHGFARHGRDYVVIAQVAGGGTYELTLTHVVEQHFETNVKASVWQDSWDDILTDYRRWEANGFQPEGYVWGTNWSNAYPGIELLNDHPGTKRWSDALGRPMFAFGLSTDRFKLSLIFHDARWRKLSNEDATVASTLNPLSGPVRE